MTLPFPELEQLAGSVVLVTGAEGMLGRAFTDILSQVPGCTVRAFGHKELDITSREMTLAQADQGIDIIVHCAADVNADLCETNPEQCHRVQVDGTLNVLEIARRNSSKLLYPQSFLVFDGKELPITEATIPSPLSVYGQCKYEAEQHVLEHDPGHIVVRMAGFFGGGEKDKNFVGKFCRHLATMMEKGERAISVGDRVWQPTFTHDLAANSLLLLAHEKSGIYNMASHDEATFFEIAEGCVNELGIGQRIDLTPVSADEVSRDEAAARPRRAVMENRRLAADGLDRQRGWRAALADYLSGPYYTDMFEPYRQRMR